MTEDEIDDQMAANFAVWLSKRPPKPQPASVLVTGPVVDDRWLTYSEAATETRLGLSTIKTMVRQGELDTRRTSRGHVRIRAGSLWQSETRRVG